PQQQAIRAEQMEGGDELVQIVSHEYPGDAQKTAHLAQSCHRRVSFKRARRCSRFSRSCCRISTDCRNAPARERTGSNRLSSWRYSAKSCISECRTCLDQTPRS